MCLIGFWLPVAAFIPNCCISSPLIVLEKRGVRVQGAKAHRRAAVGMNRLRWKAVSAEPIAFNKLSSNCYIDGEGLSPSGSLMMGGLLRSSPL